MTIQPGSRKKLQWQPGKAPDHAASQQRICAFGLPAGEIDRSGFGDSFRGIDQAKQAAALQIGADEIIETIKANPAAIDNVEEFKKTMDTFSAPNPFMVGDAKLTYVGTTSFGQKRQVSVPLVVNEFKDGKFETLFVAQVD